MNKILLLLLITTGLFQLSAQDQFSLEQAVGYGLSHHSNMKMNDLDYLSAEQTIRGFKSTGMPKVNGGIDYSYYLAVPTQPVVDFISPSIYNVLFQENVIPERALAAPETFKFSFVQPNVLTANIGASIQLFDGTYIYGLKAAKLYKELIKKERIQSEQMITSKVTKAYMSILIAEKNKEVISQNIKVLEKSLSDIKIVYQNGFAESLDVDRMQLSLETLQTQIENLDQMIQLSYNLLKFQMNYPIDLNIVVTDNLDSMVKQIKVDEITIDGPIDMSRRAEFGVIEASQQLNELDFKRTKAGFLPSANAFVNFQESLQRNYLFDNNEIGWLPTAVAGISIKAPIYDGGMKKAQMENIKLKMNKTDLQKQDLERLITLQVRNSQRSIINAKNIVDNSKKNLKLSKRIYDKTKIKFKEGIGSSIEVTQAEADLYQAQGNYINALYDLLIAKTDYNLALAKK